MVWYKMKDVHCSRIMHEVYLIYFHCQYAKTHSKRLSAALL